MGSTKSLATSKTFWGALLMLASTASQYFKIDIGDPTEWVEAITGAIGFALTLYGRIKAVKKIE